MSEEDDEWENHETRGNWHIQIICDALKNYFHQAKTVEDRREAKNIYAQLIEKEVLSMDAILADKDLARRIMEVLHNVNFENITAGCVANSLATMIADEFGWKME